ncbi:MAG TPA: penicillin-insensitive murein endopeptidase [Stellaceae bacterium]|jgi:penicillin-insensitive murein endopeptidase|nr:penicillin-insensitive murein endopeptidase [Stellaceae bacterium]
MRLVAGLAALLVGLSAAARAEDLAASEAAKRAQLMAALPADAAKRVFGGIAAPNGGPWRSIGRYDRGCIGGAVPLPPDGANWQVMRPARNRAWGSPLLIATIERLAASAAQATGWPGLLIGDVGQPRGGPMITGHASHQIGLDADIWVMPMPDRRLSREERDNLPAQSLVTRDGNGVDPALWNPSYRKLYETVARMPELARMFVNPAIKRELCKDAGADRDWLRKLRPWWGHDDHFHIRLTCPPGQTLCENQDPPPPGDGCGKELDWWFTPEARHPKPSPPSPPLRVSQLPPECAAIAAAP